MTALAGGKKGHDFGTDDEVAKRIIDRVRQHLRLGGELPLPHRLFWADENEADEDLDVYAQFARDAAPSKSQADIDEWLLTVNDAPADDAPRRALADAVRARNPKRARLIDLGLAIAEHRRQGRLPPDALAHEEGALLAAHGRAWAGPLAALARAYVFRRGFIEDLTLPADAVDAFTKRGAGPFSKDPGQPRFGLYESCALLDLHIDGAKGRIVELLARQPFATLRSLRLPAQGLTDEDAIALASCPQLANLRGLELRANQIGWEGLRAIAAALRNLRWLDFAANAVEDPAADDEAPEAGLSETGRRLIRELGPLPWLESPPRSAQGLTPLPEQLS